jgi:hypothetical protein
MLSSPYWVIRSHYGVKKNFRFSFLNTIMLICAGMPFNYPGRVMMNQENYNSPSAGDLEIEKSGIHPIPSLKKMTAIPNRIFP